MASILVVDDNPVIRTIFEQTLRRGGYNLYVAGNGAQALAILEREAVDLVITDMWMPDITGADLVRHIASGPKRPRIIVVTGDPPSLKSCELQHQIDGMLTKPINLSDLKIMVAQLCQSETAAPLGTG